jgi:hypothetical protein
MSSEYTFFGKAYAESDSSDSSESSDSQKICWKTKYCQLLHEYEELLCCFHCHVQNMNATMKEEEEEQEEEEEEKKTSIIGILKKKNLHLVNTIMGLQRDIKYKVPMGPPLHPVNDMSSNVPRVLNIYSHPSYAHKYYPHRPRPRPHPKPYPHPYPYPYPYPYNPYPYYPHYYPHYYRHRDMSMNVPHHPTSRPIMPQNAHIPPPIIKHPSPSPPPPTEIKQLSKDILPYLSGSYPYGGYPYNYPYGYGYGYPYCSNNYYRGLEDRDIELPPPPPHPHPPLHPVLHTNP